MMMITTLVNMCDIIEYLIKFVCNDPNAFEWLVQLRFFYDDDAEECLIKQTKAVLKYGYEYLGNRERLIVTPLTERYIFMFAWIKNNTNLAINVQKSVQK